MIAADDAAAAIRAPPPAELHTPKLQDVARSNDFVAAISPRRRVKGSFQKTAWCGASL